MNKLESFFWHLRDLLRELKPLRFSLIVTGLGALVFLCVDEGTEVLRAMAEPGKDAGLPDGWRWTAFFAGLVIWCMANWYCSRVLLYFEFPGGEGAHPDGAGWAGLHGWLREHLPRILGAAPMWVVGASLLNALRTYETATPAWPWLCGFGVFCTAGGFAIWGGLALRRRILDRNVMPSGDSTKSLRPQYRSLRELEPGTRRALWLIALCCALSFAAFTIHPLFFADKIGTGAVLMLSAASWVFAGSALIYWGSWHRLPIVTFLFIWIALCSFHNDNHRVRTLPRAKFQRPLLAKAIGDWRDFVKAKYPERANQPLFIVATEGGGIRAAYWTATVLGTLQDQDASFSDHLFAISGVSGGSVGAAVFAALVAEGTTADFAKRGQEVLGVDFLSPAMAALLYPDFLQRFIPWAIPYLDRGSWLEKAWEKAWRGTAAKFGGEPTDRLAEPFLDLWAKKKADFVPALFLNGTSVEVGNRLIASNLLVDGNFLDANDAAGKLFPESEHEKRRAPELDTPLSTAAHDSARFTYVSPAGRFDADGSHVVDGGYFENSGAATALDILHEVERVLGSGSGIVPRIIMISNDPLGTASFSRKLSQAKSTRREAARHQPGAFLGDALTPVAALFSTREARGSYAQKAISVEQVSVTEALGKAVPPVQVGKRGPFFFSLAPAAVPLPLGWMLSNGAARAMQEEMYDRGVSAEIKDPHLQPANVAETKRVLQSLRGELP